MYIYILKSMGETSKQVTMSPARLGRAQGPTEPLAAGSLAPCSLLPRVYGQTSRRWGGHPSMDVSHEHIYKDRWLLNHLGTGKSTNFRARCHMHTSVS